MRQSAEIIALILAGGESRRMNSPKMLLPFDGKTIIEKVIDNVTASYVNRTIVVLGGYRDEIINVIKKYPVTFYYNENYKQGMLSSVKCGFRSMPADYRAALVFLGDQPMIAPEVTNAVIAAYNQTGKGIVIPVWNTKRGHPLLISAGYKDEIEKLEEKEGLRLLAQKFPEDVLEVETNTTTILRDIDTPEDYAYEKTQIQ
jgi:molybdenum cofactor cytidylyltransferase